MPGDIYSDYDPFARVYNTHWGGYFVPLAMSSLESLVFPYIPEDAAILDLCCGTGQLSRMMAVRGYRVTGLDGSTEMLRFAATNAPGVELIRDDARSFDLPGRFHAVVSVFDSLNHVMKPEELSRVFQNVFRGLKPGGIFFFDLNMDAGFRSDWHRDSHIVEPDLVCIIRTSYNVPERRARFFATVFYQDNGWQRSDFTLSQRCYRKEDVISAIEKAGFTEVRAGAFGLGSEYAELTEEAERGFFICKKPLLEKES